MEELLKKILGFGTDVLISGPKRVAKNVKAGLGLRSGVDEYSSITQKNLDVGTKAARQALLEKDPNKRNQLLNISRVSDEASGQQAQLLEQTLGKRAGIDLKDKSFLNQPSYLRQGLEVATDAATLALPAAKSLKGIALLNAALGGAKAASQNDNPLLGAAGGAVGGVIGGRVIPAAARAVFRKVPERIMNSLLREEIGATRKAVATGGKTLGKEALARGEMAFSEQGLLSKAQSKMDEIENKLQESLKKTNVPINIKTVEAEIEKQVSKLMKTGDTNSAESLLNRWQSILSDTGGDMSAAKFNELKRLLYSQAGDNAYLTQNPTVSKDALKSIARGMKNAIEEAGQKVGISDISLLNKDLSYYGRVKDSMVDKITRDERNKIMGIVPSILASVGAGGGVGFAAGGIPGALMAAGGAAALGSTAGKTMGAQALNKTGNVLQKIFGNEIGQRLLERTGGRAVQSGTNAVADLLNPQSLQQEASQIGQTQTKDTTQQKPIISDDGYYQWDKVANDWVPTQKFTSEFGDQKQTQSEGAFAGIDKEKLMQAILLDQAVTGGKNTSSIIGKVIEQSLEPEKDTRTETQRAQEQATSLIDSAISDFSNVKGKIGEFGYKARIEDVKGAFNKGDPTILAFNAKLSAIKAAVAKMRAGTSFTPNEEKLLNQYTPSLGDSDQQIEIKLKGLREAVNTLAEKYGAQVLDPLVQ